MALAALRGVCFRCVCRLDDFLTARRVLRPRQKREREKQTVEGSKRTKKWHLVDSEEKREACAGSGTALPEGRTSNLGRDRVPLFVFTQICRHPVVLVRASRAANIPVIFA